MMTYRQKNDWGVAFVCSVIRRGLGEPDWAPAEVLLPQLPREGARARRERLGLLRAKVRGGHPWAGIRFDAAVLERPMKTADAMIERLMRHYGDLHLAGLETQRDELERLRRIIAQLVRKTLALNLLENPSLGIAQIAYCLGYSEVSTFNHAFRRWTGQPPREYRNSRKPFPSPRPY